MSIRISQWKRILKNDKVLYQCSECGNIENKQKELCCICKAKMFKDERERQ